MEICLIVLKQVAIMFILIGIGFICYKIKVINEATAKQMSEILINVAVPAVIIEAFQIDYNPSLARGLLISAVFSLAAHVIAIGVAYALIRRRGNGNIHMIERFACIYSNCGFMGLPLITAILGDTGVFYSSVFVAMFNFMFWTQGISMVSGKITPKSLVNLLKSPPVIGILLGIVMFLTSFKLPQIILEPIGYLADLNTPLAMLISGVYIAKTDILSVFKDRNMYKISAVKLLIIPALTAAMFMFFPIDETIALTIAISMACPTAATVLLIAAKYNSGAEEASKIIAFTTLLSIITIPIIVAMVTYTRGCFSLGIF